MLANALRQSMKLHGLGTLSYDLGVGSGADVLLGL